MKWKIQKQGGFESNNFITVGLFIFPTNENENCNLCNDLTENDWDEMKNKLENLLSSIEKEKT